MTNPLWDHLLAPHIGSERRFAELPDGEVLTYGAFLDGVSRAAGVLRALGLSKGDRLALQVEKSIAALEIYGACLATGVIFLPLNTAYTPEEVTYFLADADAGAFICDPGAADALAEIAARQGTRLLTLSETGEGSFAEQAAGIAPLTEPAPCAQHDIAALLYTSGTTGRSKGAMLTHANLLSNAQTLVDTWRISDADTLLHALPIFHAHGLFVAINTTLLAGADMIYLPRFSVEAVLAALPRSSTMMGVPTFYTRLLDDPRFTAERTSGMRLFTSGSAPLLAETHDRFAERTGHYILERYGMTETGMNTSNPYAAERRAGTVGFPLPDVALRITDPDTERVLPDGEIGMIEVRGPNVFKGYWRMPEKTAEELRANGWFITGDLARRDADGYVHIVGRAKDLIISGGYNVYPKEVELVLDDIDWVKESAVIGVPHPDFGEAVVAVVVAKAAPDKAALRAKLTGKLAKYKQPKDIIVVDALPRNTMGKVQKNVLRQGYLALFSDQAKAG